ncbi:MAG: SPOR domain-containing protein [Proteobacteria bacterium]|nr:SPOR domain-containing protein [Pseudomonadota bacterium]
MSDDISIPNPGYTGRRAGRYGRAARTPLSPDSKRLLLYAGGLGGLLIAMVTASTLTSHRGGPVPVIEPDPRPIRVKPENPGGLKIDAADSEVFSGGSDTANAKLAPPAETPNPNGLQALPKPKPAPVVQAPAVPTPAPNAAKSAAVTTEPAAPAKPAAPAAKPAVVAKDLPAPNKPAPTTGTAAQATAATKDAATAKPTVTASAAQPAATTPTAPATAASAAKPASGHGATVQLAALSSEQAAKEEWQKLQKQMPDIFGGRQPTIVKAERDGRTFWRLRAAGFTDVGQARSFCEKVRTKGNGCSVADF